MQLLAMPLLGELAAITGASPATAATGNGGANGADGKGAAPFGQLLAQLQGEGGKQLPPAELAAALGISVEQLQQALAQLRQALADYSRQQTGASGIMPALVDGASAGDAPAVSEDGEAFLLWLADQRQGLAGEVDPALLAALQQWLHEQQPEPVDAGLAAGGEQPLQGSDAEAAALLAAAAEGSAQQADAEAAETSKATAAESRQATVAAAATASSQQTGAITGVSGELPATVDTVSSPAVSGSESAPQAQAALASRSATQSGGEDAGTEVVATTTSDKRQTAPAVPQTVTTVASTATTTATANTATTTTNGNEQASAAATEAGAADASVSDGSERRTSATTLAATLAAQQRGGDNSNSEASSSGRDAGREQGKAATSSAPAEVGDQPQLQVGERLSQWQFQWERASNEAASGITTAATSRDSQDLRQLLGASAANLQPSRLISGVGQDSSPLLRQFSADPAAALGPQVQVMVARSLDQMTVRLDPQELGSMSIKVQVGADQQVHVQFQVTNPATRDLVEQSLPRLRELLGDAGVQLGDTQVGQQQRETRQMAGDGSGRSGDGRGGSAGQGSDGDSGLEPVVDQLQRNVGQLANGRLDLYV